MLRAIRADKTPNLLLLLLQYSNSWLVQNLLLIPRMFFTESIIERRKPLGPNARHAGLSDATSSLAKFRVTAKSR
jgi:type II restriction enzyme